MNTIKSKSIVFGNSRETPFVAVSMLWMGVLVAFAKIVTQLLSVPTV